MVHAAAIVGIFTLGLNAPRRVAAPAVVFLGPAMPAPFTGARRAAGRRAGVGRPRVAQAPVPAPAPAPPPGPPDTAPAAAVPIVTPSEILGPRVGSGALWVKPLPALPADVAEELYGRHLDRDSVAVHQLRAMVDSLNLQLAEEQRDRRKPSWTTQVAGATFGIDSQYIHIAGIKIPTAALALLPIRLPEGNFDENRRAQALEAMRQDILYSAWRAQTFADFRRYVKELRERKEAEREFRKRQTGDTAKAVQ